VHADVIILAGVVIRGNHHAKHSPSRGALHLQPSAGATPAAVGRLDPFAGLRLAPSLIAIASSAAEAPPGARHGGGPDSHLPMLCMKAQRRPTEPQVHVEVLEYAHGRSAKSDEGSTCGLYSGWRRPHATIAIVTVAAFLLCCQAQCCLARTNMKLI
jgi:hypothetical protein